MYWCVNEHNRLYEKCHIVVTNHLLHTGQKAFQKVISETEWNDKKEDFLKNLKFIQKHGPTEVVLAIHDVTFEEASHPLIDLWYYLTCPKYLLEDLEEPIESDDKSFIRFIAMLELALKLV